MIKLIESSQFADVPGIGAKFAEFNSPAMTKEAENIFGRSYSSLKPTDDKYIGIHLTALGDEETYGCNRNSDAFPREACIKYHDTFVKHGHVFSHHHNDAEVDEILGTIKASAYNAKMGRVELFIWADREKAKEGLDTLEKTGETSFSMACRVPWDQCSICGAKRKNSRDPNMCNHLRNQLGKIAENGKIAYMRNVEPDFFDISFVTRPADRIAWSLKVASGDCPTSEVLAKEAGIIVPEWLTPGLTADKRDTLLKLAEQYDAQERDKSIASSFGCVAKTAETAFDDSTVDTLRKMPIKEAMAFLTDAGTFMGPITFCKYAMGPNSAEYEKTAKKARIVGKIASQIIKDAAWLGQFDLTSQCDFDCDRFTTRPSSRFTDVTLAAGAIKQASFVDSDNILRLIAESRAEKNASDHIDENHNLCLNTSDKPILAVALKYAEYKVAAVTAAMTGASQLGMSNTNNRESLLALVAAQDL